MNRIKLGHEVLMLVSAFGLGLLLSGCSDEISINRDGTAAQDGSGIADTQDGAGIAATQDGAAAQDPAAHGPAVVNLGTAGNFAILSKAGISTTGATGIDGNIGVSPIAATAITGFGLTRDASDTFSTSALVDGKVYAADYATPTPANMTTAISDMAIAYTDAAGRSNPTATELGAGNIGGMTLAPGLYKWGTGLLIPSAVTLSGGADDVWIFQVAQTLTLSNGVHVNLSGGAQAKNIFWQVAGKTTLGTTSVMHGNILCQTQIEMHTGARLNGRALAQTAVTLDANHVTRP